MYLSVTVYFLGKTKCHNMYHVETYTLFFDCFIANSFPRKPGVKNDSDVSSVVDENSVQCLELACKIVCFLFFWRFGLHFAGQVVWVLGNFSGVIVYLLGVRRGDFVWKLSGPCIRVPACVKWEQKKIIMGLLEKAYKNGSVFQKHMQYVQCTITLSNFFLKAAIHPIWTSGNGKIGKHDVKWWYKG